MDHTDHTNHGVGGGMEMITMYFYQSERVNFLFDGYSTDSVLGYFGACMLSVCFGFLTETLSIV